ncbi:chaperonin 10-like protein [Dendryphion nanum]|uniref:Chaperonin 10-like protein n=1 Tax=Dendryphion nanum TaxID=256645 RepID=A0A9P9EIY7_9PLEO|nr:chaperonin 10-like protein [Dendryphion nanum]
MTSQPNLANMLNPSAVLYAAGDLRFEDREVPELKEGEVLVRIEYVGVCGSDVHFWRHGSIRTPLPKTGITMGHEASGTIHSLHPSLLSSPSSSSPSSTHSLAPGTRVALEPGTPCRHCEPCKSGLYNLCRHMRFAAAPGPPDTHGTLTKFFAVPADFVYPVSSNVGLDEAVLVEPLAVAVHAVKLADVRVGETVIVMGAGTVGLLCAGVARVYGARRVVCVDVMEGRVRGAEKWIGEKGVGYLVDGNLSSEENADSLLEKVGIDMAGVGGVDVVIEASGAPSATVMGIRALRPGGKYVQTGLGRGKMDGFPIVEVSEKELMVRGCFRYASGDFEMAVQLMESGDIRVKELISSVVEFGDVREAWERTARGEGVKNLIRGVRN